MSYSTPTIPPRVGRFEILERFASGGMAEVFLAWERSRFGLERVVVIKRVLPQLAGHESIVRMFLHEARVAARIAHPNVVNVIELGEHEGQPYLAMEYVAGVTIKELIYDARRLRRVMPVGVAVHLIAQACAGAHAAHEMRDSDGRPAGLVHRDLSPHNLMVDGRAHIKVLDFGIAKVEADAEQTRTGALKGKVRYMSPEQCLQEDLDRRSDVFTLGIVAWELLAAERLFEQHTDLATMQAITGGQIRSLAELRPDCPPAIVAAIEQALAVRKEDRYPSADTMRRALLDAAAQARVTVNADVAASFVQSVMGAELDARQRRVDLAVEKARQKVAPTTTTPSPMPVLAAGLLGIGVLGLSAALIVLAATALVVRQENPPLHGPPISISVAPFLDAGTLQADYAPLARYLERKTGRPVEWRIGADYADAGRMVASGETPYGVLPASLYVRTATAVPLQLLAVKQFDNSNGTDGVVLVRQSGIAVPEDLRGHTICYTDRDSTTGYILPRAWLRTQGVDPDVDLTLRWSGNHYAAMRDLEEGRCDVAGTYSGAFLTGDQHGVHVARLRVLGVTGRTPNDAFVAGPSADPQVSRAMQDALLSLSPSRDLGIERIGSAERISGFAPPDDRDYDRIREAIAAEAIAARAHP